jgi:hypothetical protein
MVKYLENKSVIPIILNKIVPFNKFIMHLNSYSLSKLLEVFLYKMQIKIIH